MITIEFNGESKRIEEQSTIADLLRLADVKSNFCAVELNLEIVPKGQYDLKKLADGDQLEVVTLVGGG